jgi:DNA invertase Pin-like site-specific DNA recombinase
MKQNTVAAIYARVSTKDKGQDPENQLTQLREYCARQGLKIAEEYTDQASGKTAAKRDAFKRMFEDASRRKFDVVIVWALDRFTREGVHETFNHIKRLNDYGVQFESYTEPHFRTTGPAGELMLAVAAWIAKQERQRISDRTKAGLKIARREGKTLGRPRCVVDRDKIRQLQKQGLSLRQIGKQLKVAPVTIFRRMATKRD